MLQQPDARQILASRLASGEITEKQYDRILSRLGSEQPASMAPAPEQPVFRPEISPRVEPSPSSPRLESQDVKTTPASMTSPKDASPKRSFYLIRLWRGEISLPVTYWIWGTIVSSIVGLVFGGLMGASTTKGEAAIFALILVAWTTFMMVSIVRSGGAYSRSHPKRWWGRIAQGLACLGLLATIGNILRAFPGNEIDADLDQVVADVNRPGPHMVADNVRFNNATRQGRTFVYNFTVTGDTHVPSADKIQEARAATITDACKHDEIRRLLLSVDKVTYHYYGDSGNDLMQFDIKQGDCSS